MDRLKGMARSDSEWRNKMKGRWLLAIFLALGPLWGTSLNPCDAQNRPKTLTLLYSNNINGEIEPCPT